MNQIVGVNVAEHPLTEYQAYLRQVGLSETSVKIYLTALRRMFKHLSEEDCANPQMVAYYRANLSQFLRAPMGVAWRHYRDFAREKDVWGLIDLPALPPYRFPHPLYPDVVDIMAEWLPGKAANITWRELRQIGTPALIRAFERIEEFHGVPHESEDAPASPYREWILTHISRSADTMTDHRGLEKLLLSIYERASRLNAAMVDLKTFYAVFVNRRSQLIKQASDLREKVTAILESEMPWEAMREDLLIALRGKRMLLVEEPRFRKNILFW